MCGIAIALVVAQNFCVFSVRGEKAGDLPVVYPPARYEQMVKKSPFALATPVVAAPATPGFATNLYVTGVAKIGNADFVSISTRDQQSRFSLLAGESSSEGISLVSVEWSDQIGKSRVTVKKGTEFAVLEFDQAALVSNPIQVPPQVAPPPMPVQPGVRPNVPGRVILPNPGITPGQSGVVAPRQRLRIINSKPQ